MADTQNQSSDTPEENSGFVSIILSKLKVIGAVIGLIVVESLVAYFIIPSPEDVISAAEMSAKNSATLSEDQAEDLNIPQADNKHVEVDLKEFGITAYQPNSSTTMRIDFHLYATINIDDQDEFNGLIEQNTNRLREQIIVTIRSSDASALTDPTLGLLKRKILEKTNRILGKPLVKSIIFSDYSFIEQ